MANIFISYNREDEDKTKALVDDIQELGHTVWFDHELSGGQKWWDTILESVRNCDILVFALSVESLNSSACSLEYDYASKLGKTILPVLVGEKVSVNLLPSALSKIQFVDYRKRDRDALIHLAKAFTTAPPSQPLPDQLPLPPDIPVSYLGSLSKHIENESNLSYEEQSALFIDLKRSLRDSKSAEDAQVLLQKLRKRRDLLASISEEIDELLGNTMDDPDILKVEHTILKQSQNQKKRNFLLGLAVIIIVIVSLYYVKESIIIPISDDNKTIPFDPAQALTYANKGYALNNIGEYKKAIDILDKAISIDPNYALSYSYKGYALNGLKRYNEAIATFGKAISIDPGQALDYANKGYALKELKRYNEAIAAFDKAISIDPGQVWYYSNKGYALNQLGRHNEAKAAFDEANRH